MTSLKEIDKKIEIMRENLHSLVESKGYHFVDKDVMILSKRLDVLLVERERCKIVKRK